MVKEKMYVGLRIKQFIRDNKLTNGFALRILNNDGFALTDTRFSNKLYGEREQFEQPEIDSLNAGLDKAGFKTDFIL